MLKDIYSPLEIDDQWDQRAPVHEDKTEGGNADGMSTVTPEVPVENPGGGGVAVMDQPVAEAPPVSDTSETQEAPTVDPAQAPSIENGVPGMQTPVDMTQAPAEQAVETTEAPSEITQFHPADSEESTAPVTMEEPTTEPVPPTSEISTSESTGTETPEEDSDDYAASVLNGTEHDVPASRFDAAQETDTPADSSGTTEPTGAIPTTVVEPDADVQAIVDRPLTDEESERVASASESESDQLPVATSEERANPDDDLVLAEVSRGKEKVLKAIESELDALNKTRDRLRDELAKHEQERADADAQATATQAQIDQVDAAISELESKK